MTDSAVTLALIEHRDGDPRSILNENYWSRLIELSRQRDRVIEALNNYLNDDVGPYWSHGKLVSTQKSLEEEFAKLESLEKQP